MDELDLKVIEAALHFVGAAMEKYPSQYSPEASCAFNVQLLKVQALRAGRAAAARREKPIRGTLFPEDPGAPALIGEFHPVGKVRDVEQDAAHWELDQEASDAAM